MHINKFKMKRFIEKIIQIRNPFFKFDSEVDSYILFILFYDKVKSLVRGLKMLFYLKYSKYLMLGRSVTFIYVQNIILENLSNLMMVFF